VLDRDRHGALERDGSFGRPVEGDEDPPHRLRLREDLMVGSFQQHSHDVFTSLTYRPAIVKR